MAKINFQCLKCSNTSFEKDEFRATGGVFSKLLDIQSKRFTTITCTQCKYTEIYKTAASNFENIADFFLGR